MDLADLSSLDLTSDVNRVEPADVLDDLGRHEQVELSGADTLRRVFP